MLNISKYLEKIAKNINSGELLNSTIIEIVKKHTNIVLKPEDFEVRDNQISLKTSPTIKNKLFIYKRYITEDIERSTALKNINIR